MHAGFAGSEGGMGSWRGRFHEAGQPRHLLVRNKTEGVRAGAVQRRIEIGPVVTWYSRVNGRLQSWLRGLAAMDREAGDRLPDFKVCRAWNGAWKKSSPPRATTRYNIHYSVPSRKDSLQGSAPAPDPAG